MNQSTIDSLRTALSARTIDDPTFATEAVDQLLRTALAAGVSDLHLLPSQQGLEIAWRVDGVLQPLAILPAAASPRIIARLKVLADLLTYRTDVPQEGRIKQGLTHVEMRLSTFPTLPRREGRFADVRQAGNLSTSGGIWDYPRRSVRLSAACSHRPPGRSSSADPRAAVSRPRFTLVSASSPPPRKADAAWRRW